MYDGKPPPLVILALVAPSIVRVEEKIVGMVEEDVKGSPATKSI